MRVVLMLISCFFAVLSYSQVTVAVSSNLDTIEFGGEVELAYNFTVPPGEQLRSVDFSSFENLLNFAYSAMPDQLDSLMEVEVVDGGAYEIANGRLVISSDDFNGGIPLSGTVKLSMTSIGATIIPKPIVNGQASMQDNLAQGIQLFVKPLEGMEDINPNWDIIEEEVSWKDYLKYVYIFLGLIALGLGGFYLARYLRKDQPEIQDSKVEIIIPAHEKAIRDLDNLKGKELWQSGDVKGYHTELTRIMRQYLEDRYQVQALEMTTSQLQRELNKREINSAIVMRFNDILLIADKVKFAKGEAGPEINARFMDEAYSIIDETKEIEIKEETTE